MDIKIKLKNILSNYNPFAISHRNRMQKKLVNRDFSFICPNCLGGMLLHDLGLPFLSPTVNLMIHQREFVKFALDIDYYLSQNFIFIMIHIMCVPVQKSEKAIERLLFILPIMPIEKRQKHAGKSVFPASVTTIFSYLQWKRMG